MKHRSLTEMSADFSSSVEIAIDSKGTPKPVVKIYFDDPGDAIASSWKAMETINWIMKSWNGTQFETPGHQKEE
jgi:hypothetical protein